MAIIALPLFSRLLETGLQLLLHLNLTMGRPLWSSRLIERERLVEKEKEQRERQREWKIREEEMTLLGWTSFVPLRDSGLWGVVEGNTWNDSAPTQADQDAHRRTTITTPRPETIPNPILDREVNDRVRDGALLDYLQIAFSQEVRGELSSITALSY